REANRAAFNLGHKQHRVSLFKPFSQEASNCSLVTRLAIELAIAIKQWNDLLEVGGNGLASSDSLHIFLRGYRLTLSLAAPLLWRRSHNEKGVRRPSAAYYSDWLNKGLLSL